MATHPTNIFPFFRVRKSFFINRVGWSGVSWRQETPTDRAVASIAHQIIFIKYFAWFSYP